MSDPVRDNDDRRPAHPAVPRWTRLGRYREIGFAWKRAFDLAALLAGAPLWLPLLAVVAVWVRWALGSPVLFRQERPGHRGRVFRMMKFRSMTDARDASAQLLPDTERLVPFGRRLRSTSLDELPELLNVLRGEMSLVGPRPLLVRYLSLYSPEQARRHDVPPGITGWAQVCGRNALTWEAKFAHDVWYVDHASLGLDLHILLRTVRAVLLREGISAAGEATMPEFRGGKQ
ncbi:MAG: sugar transferase [Verrucomicrobia bacterium]|nr:MAG: sugar transferase [Verrucomicrobiota bacterium]